VATQTPGLREIRLVAGSTWAGQAVGQLSIRDRFGVTILAVSRSGRSHFNPGPDFQIFPGDRLFLSGEAEGLDQAIEYLSRVDFAERDDEHQAVIVEERSLDTLPRWQGRSIADLELRSRFGLTVVAIRQPDGRLVGPDPRRVLTAGDHLVLTGTADAMARLRGAGALTDV
jgi:K+/H+ antiporter YhaU regulatory subunit KhtT